MIIFFIIVIIFIIASFISLYSYGRFAKRAKGEPSYALPIQPDQTQLDRSLNSEFLLHPEQSSLMLIPSDLDAFAIRALSAREAGRSLDLQYYIWHDDLTGQLLGLEILKAADRGVRVRILLDDMNSHNNSRLLATMNLHPNIEIRMFNPTRSRNNTLMRGIEMLLRFFSVNRRMHNKSWIADGRIAIVGGRNIGNEYFGAADDRNFFDVDLLIGGHAVQDATTIFDDFWNSDAVIPIKALIFTKPDSLDKLRKRINKKQDSVLASPYIQRLEETQSVKALFEGRKTDENWQLHWSKNVHVISDPPSKVFDKNKDGWLLIKLLPILSESRKTLKIISPYFVPGKIGVAQFSQLYQTGVEIEILTNSLVTNDVIMAHGGYAPYRIPLLKNGICLYELRPFGKTGKKLIGSSGASLHTKAFLVDSQLGFVGSFNFDPRSANLNTEMGILFEDPEIVKALQHEFELRSSQDFSYQVLFKNGKLHWQGLDNNDQHRVWFKEPQSKWWQRIATKIIAKLPIESQL